MDIREFRYEVPVRDAIEYALRDGSLIDALTDDACTEARRLGVTDGGLSFDESPRAAQITLDGTNFVVTFVEVG